LLFFHFIEDEVKSTSYLNDGKKTLKKNFALEKPLLSDLEENIFIDIFRLYSGIIEDEEITLK